mmetsp:Transcript_38098/g.106018  ORF Transcript_38098/g.106018 Transcript_38098/m.106018 type:complete len:275 (-) Transcript_38098:144-968(-)
MLCPVAVSTVVFTAGGMCMGYMAQIIFLGNTPGAPKIVGALLMVNSIVVMAVANKNSPHCPEADYESEESGSRRGSLSEFFCAEVSDFELASETGERRLARRRESLRESERRDSSNSSLFSSSLFSRGNIESGTASLTLADIPELMPGSQDRKGADADANSETPELTMGSPQAVTHAANSYEVDGAQNREQRNADSVPEISKDGTEDLAVCSPEADGLEVDSVQGHEEHDAAGPPEIPEESAEHPAVGGLEAVVCMADNPEVYPLEQDDDTFFI